MRSQQCNRVLQSGSELPEYVAPLLRNGGSQSPDRWLKEHRNNHFVSLLFLVSASKEGVVHNRSFFVILTTDSFEALFISYFKPAGIWQLWRPRQVPIYDFRMLQVMIVWHFCEQIFQVFVYIQVIGTCARKCFKRRRSA